jgi:digalactosyldiacylglycerol synthase
MFHDRMAAVSFTLINHEHDATMSNGTFFDLDGDDDEITPQSDLLLPNRNIFIVTTAALPWRTGTAVNPLLRAAYLARRAREINNNQTLVDEQMSQDEAVANSTGLVKVPLQRQMVTLVIPWLELEEDRLELYGPDTMFASIQDQEDYIRDWLRNEAKMEDVADADTGLKIIFYPARYHSGLKSIFAMGDMVGDICAVLRNQTDGGILNNSVCILEEPEHLNWYRAPGEGWTKVFNYVVGIIHTNYVEYAGSQFHGLWTVSDYVWSILFVHPY